MSKAPVYKRAVVLVIVNPQGAIHPTVLRADPAVLNSSRRCLPHPDQVLCVEVPALLSNLPPDVDPSHHVLNLD